MKNYKLIEEKYLKNYKSHALVFEHEKTLAKVFIMSNADDNKVFGIGFRTPPKSSNGVCHIIEHAVLNGSRKYQTKEPFMDILKSSLNTFLNAMTYPDKTIYPVASRNDKDFRNLTDLYLDAVFNPRVKEEEKIFRQEGWRYNLEDDKLTYKGVVYNEMKGSMSSLESQAFSNIYEELQPDTIYAYNSGGDPYEIPNLTYEEFLDYYNEFYHPSNAYIFLYGNMDYEEYLNYIDKEYLSNYDFKSIDSTLKSQKRFNGTRYAVRYLNTNKAPKVNESFISYSVLTGYGNDTKTRILSDLLSSALISNDSSPLKQKLLKSGLLDVIMSASQNTVDTSFSILAKNINADNRDEFVKIIEEELQNIVENGIDKELIQMELNDYKFEAKEGGTYTTKGIPHFINAFDSWLYDKSPIEAVDIEEEINFIESNLDNNILEDFIKNNILNSKHKSIVTHIPQMDLNKNKDAEIKKNLENMKNSLNTIEKENLEKFTKEMLDFQNRENTPEEKATIPTLKKEDVDTKLDKINREVFEKEQFTILKHNLNTSGVDYLILSFDIDHIVEPEEILYANLLSTLLGNMDTKKHNYSELNKNIFLNTGGIYFGISQYLEQDTKNIKRKLNISTKYFSENNEKVLDIILEMLNDTIFENKEHLKEILLEIKAAQEIGLLSAANSLMVQRAISNHLELFKYSEYINGVEYILFIKNILEENIDVVINKLKSIYNKIFTRKNLIIDIASDFSTDIDIINNLELMANQIEYKDFEKAHFEFQEQKKSEGFTAISDVNYVCLGNKLNMEYNSKLVVLNNFISNEFLYSEIRAKNGAYGTGLLLSKNGNFGTYSYRDPNLIKTLEIYKQIPEFLKNSKINDEELLPYIIGAAGNVNPPLTERMKASLDLSLYITNRTIDDLENEIHNLLDTDANYIKSLSAKLEELIKSSSLAVLGNKDTIEENKELFDEIIEL